MKTLMIGRGVRWFATGRSEWSRPRGHREGVKGDCEQGLALRRWSRSQAGAIVDQTATHRQLRGAPPRQGR